MSLVTQAREALGEQPSAEATLRWAEKNLGTSGAIASSFAVEDVVVLALAARVAPSLTVFTLDTGRLPPETYEILDVLTRRFGLNVQTYFPERQAVEQLVNAKGHFSFRESLEARKECCRLRKVEPLRRALAGRAGWVTGLRREQAPTRAGVDVVEADDAHGLIKLNPLATWSTNDVWAFVRENQLPYHTLHDRGYASIGCAPCTRAVKPTESIRAGRWWWESAEHKECGLHVDGGRRG